MSRSSTFFVIATAVGILAGMTVLTGCESHPSHYIAGSHSEEHGGDSASVTIDNFSFTSATLTVPVGTTVTWVNHDDIPHTVVSTEQKFKSKALDTDESFSFTFNDPGSYPYFCSLHPKMVAKVIVEAKK